MPNSPIKGTNARIARINDLLPAEKQKYPTGTVMSAIFAPTTTIPGEQKKGNSEYSILQMVILI